MAPDLRGKIATAGAAAVVADVVEGIIGSAIAETRMGRGIGLAVGFQNNEPLRALAPQATGVPAGPAGVVRSQRAVGTELIEGQHEADAVTGAAHGARHFKVVRVIVWVERRAGAVDGGLREPETIDHALVVTVEGIADAVEAPAAAAVR